MGDVTQPTLRPNENKRFTQEETREKKIAIYAYTRIPYFSIFVFEWVKWCHMFLVGPPVREFH